MAEDRDPLRHLETITPEQWACLSAPMRAQYNALRQQRGLPPLPGEPAPTAPMPSWWPRLSAARRRERNQERIARGLRPYPDLPKGTEPPPLPQLSVADPAMAAREFLGPVDDGEDEEHFVAQLAQEPMLPVAVRLALELAQTQLAKQALHKEVEYRAIAEFVALAQKETRWSHGKIIEKAEGHFGVSRATVERAIKACAEDEKLALIARVKVDLTK